MPTEAYVDGDGARQLAKTKEPERRTYKIAAQIRTVYLGPMIDQVGGLVIYGREAGWLPF